MSSLRVMRDPTVRSPRRNTRLTIVCSAGSKTPARVPCSIMTAISFSVTGGSSEARSPMRRVTTSVERVRKETMGENSFDSHFMGRAMMEAIRSGLCNAMRLGTSSPMMSDRYVMTRTTMPRPMDSAYEASKGKVLKYAVSFSAMVAPPKAPARMPMSVIPVCTVERKRLGDSASSRAVFAL